MDLFEYQGKSLYQKFNINHPNSKLIKNLNDLNDPIDLNFPVVVKAQVQVGGRGKAGGIKVAKDINELTQYSEEILGMDINCLLYTSPSPRDAESSRMPSSA